MITLQRYSGSVRSHSIRYWHTRMWRFIGSSFNSLDTNFAQSFFMPKSSVIIFQIMPFFMSSWLSLIRTFNWRKYLLYPFDIVLWKCLACWISPVLGVVLYLTAHLFERFVPFKNTCIRNGVISIHFLKYFDFLWWDLLQMDQTFQVYSWLGVRSLVIMAEQLKKRSCRQKLM